MSNKLKMAHADRITDARRDAVITAAIDFVKNPATPMAHTLAKVVERYEAFCASMECECPAPDVCERHAHCFINDNVHRD
ncbi:hypothetical protein [Bradyrhizobium sp. RT10b]|uniref:hypothetical protein n=1 Tax=Bradyrhizobium sp. RT10b TaxID=3156331 RepID=UPI00339A6D1B